MSRPCPVGVPALAPIDRMVDRLMRPAYIHLSPILSMALPMHKNHSACLVTVLDCFVRPRAGALYTAMWCS